jgi:3-hydroxyisobutyrate dehydrogenase-like beta-hydroxyacid dehydrogenase
MRKDAELARKLATRTGVRVPAAAAAASILEEATRSGLADADMASVITLLSPHDDTTETP